MNTSKRNFTIDASAALIRVNKWLVGLLVVFAFSSCSTPSGNEYYFILKDGNNPYWKTVGDAIEETGNKEGIATVVKYVSDAKKDDPTWCQNAISRRPKIVVMGGVGPDQETECFRETQKLDIKSADINGSLSSQQAAAAGFQLAFSLKSDDMAAGERAAEYIANHKKRPDPKILAIQAPAPKDIPSPRLVGFKTELKRLVPQAVIVNTASVGWGPDAVGRAKGVTADTIKTVPDLDAIFVTGDGTAIGAADAVKAAGKTKQIQIVSIDGSPGGCLAVKAGLITATVSSLPYWTGERVVQKAIEVVQGKNTVPTEHAPKFVITKEVLDSKKDPMLKYLR